MITHIVYMLKKRFRFQASVKNSALGFPNHAACLPTQQGISLAATAVLSINTGLFLAVIWKVILRPLLPSLTPCGGGRWDLVAGPYPCQLVEPRSTPHFLDAKFWRALPSLIVTCATLQFPPQAIQGPQRFDQSSDGSWKREQQL